MTSTFDIKQSFTEACACLTMIEFGSWFESAGSEMGMRPEHMVRMSRGSVRRDSGLKQGSSHSMARTSEISERDNGRTE